MTMQDLWEGSENRERAGGRLVLVLILVAGPAAGRRVRRRRARRRRQGPARHHASPASTSAGSARPMRSDGSRRISPSGPMRRSRSRSRAPTRCRWTPAEIGLSVDYAASVAAAGGEQTWDPRRLWDYYTGGDDLDAVVEVDDDALQAALTDLGADAGHAGARRSGPVHRLGCDDQGPRRSARPSTPWRPPTPSSRRTSTRSRRRPRAQRRAARHRRGRRPRGPGLVRQPGDVRPGDPDLRQVPGAAVAAGVRRRAVDGAARRRAGARPSTRNGSPTW